MLNVFEDRAKQLLHDYWRRLGPTGRVAVEAERCACMHSGSWHPDGRNGQRRPCVYPGCRCSSIDLRGSRMI